DTTLSHTLTSRLTGTIGYHVQRANFEAGESSTVHTLRVGGAYQLTPSLTAAATGGAAIETRRSGTSVGPAASVSVTKQFWFGAASLNYTRGVGTAGTLGETTENQSIGATLVVTSLLRGFALSVAPRY